MDIRNWIMEQMIKNYRIVNIYYSISDGHNWM